jgi:hypothetical protein
VILSFVVIADAPAPELEDIRDRPGGTGPFVREGTTLRDCGGPDIEHGLRHLAWLAEDDPTVRSVLNDSWPQALAGYMPEPFKHLG